MNRQRVFFILLTGAIALLIGCGGSSSKATAGSSPTATGSDASDGSSAFRQCLSEHGVTLPAGGSGAFSDGGPGGFSDGGPGGFSGGTPPSFPTGSDQGATQSAIAACQSLAPAGGAPGQGGQGGQAFQAYTSCLGDHGVVVPGAASTDSSAAGPPPTFDRNDPSFASANEICQALLPQAATSTTVAP